MKSLKSKKYSVMSVAEIKALIELLQRFEKLSFVQMCQGGKIVKAVGAMAGEMLRDIGVDRVDTRSGKRL